MHTQCWGCRGSQLIKCLLAFAEEWWAVHSHPAGGDATRHCVRNEIPVWHGLRAQRSGCQEYPHQQQLGLQGVRLRPLQSPRRWPWSSIHHQGELRGYQTDWAQEKCISCHILVFRLSSKEVSMNPEPLNCARRFDQVITVHRHQINFENVFIS